MFDRQSSTLHINCASLFKRRLIHLIYLHVFVFTDQIRANIALEIKRMHRRRQLPYPSCSPPHPGSSPSASPGISPSASPPPQDCLAHTSNSQVSYYALAIVLIIVAAWGKTSTVVTTTICHVQTLSITCRLLYKK